MGDALSALSDGEKGSLRYAAKKIRYYKLVQIRGYRVLVDRAKDERIRQLLIRIVDDEEKIAEFWSGNEGAWRRFRNRLSSRRLEGGDDDEHPRHKGVLRMGGDR